MRKHTDAEELIKTKNIIRAKVQALKEGNLQQKQFLGEFFKPVTEQVETVVGEIKKKAAPQIKKKDDFPGYGPSVGVSPIKKRKIEKEDFKTPFSTPKTVVGYQELEDVAESLPESSHNQSINSSFYTHADMDALVQKPAVMNSFLEQYDELPAAYIKQFLIERPSLGRYGVNFNFDENKFSFGDSEVQIIDSDLIIKGKRYEGTGGLYELLFTSDTQSNPTTRDIENYRDIIDRTYAAHRNFNKNEQTVGFNQPKYRKFVRPKPVERRKPTPKKRTGKGLSMLKKVSNKPLDYVYWDNPNELVDRLRLLYASQAAGHTNHDNEIVSIIEELKEASIIE